MVDLGSQPDIQNFGRTLKTIRDASGLSQKELAAMAGVTIKQISKLENGRAEPKYLTLIALADAMRVELNDFRREYDELDGQGDGDFGVGGPEQGHQPPARD